MELRIPFAGDVVDSFGFGDKFRLNLKVDVRWRRQINLFQLVQVPKLPRMSLHTLIFERSPSDISIPG